MNYSAPLEIVDPDIFEAVERERERQEQTLVLIASENYVSEAVLEAQGTNLTNKYAEGYPGRRYYSGCAFVDEAENLAIERAKALFGADHANVQAHAGTTANLAVYFAVLQPGDRILGMNLSHGGHLSHGASANFTGHLYEPHFYGVSRESEQIDYDEVGRLAARLRPKLIIAGASSYSRIIDFGRFREIADEVGAYLMADIAHTAGLVAAGVHPSPVPYAHFVTGTTHKTMRGPRGGFVLCQRQFADRVDRTIFPGLQGGPLMHIVAAKAVCFLEAITAEFQAYQRQVVINARVMANAFEEAGLRVVSGGTDNLLLLVDLSSRGLTGRDAQEVLEYAGISVNRNVIPYDTRTPQIASGIRVGTPAVTTRGMKEDEMVRIVSWIKDVLEKPTDEKMVSRIAAEVKDVCSRFPIYPRQLPFTVHEASKLG